MPETIQHIDEQILLFLNDLHNPVLDFMMYWLSHKWIWVPLYVFLAYLIIRKWKLKFGLIIIAMAFGLLGLSELISSGLFKPWIQRLRPCHVPELFAQLHFISDSCGGKYGFFSSHASDSFSVTIFLFLLFGKERRWYLLIFWAFMVSVSRVYLGQHYPTDILTGMCCGTLLGWIGYMVFKKVQSLSSNHSL